MRFNHRRRQGGQALVELAISVPVLLWLLLGSFDATVMVSDKVIAGYATRQGARLAAEIGGLETNPGVTTAQVDQDIVRNVLAVAIAMNYSTLTELDIYAPRSATGVLNKATDLYDQYDGAGNNQNGYPFGINLREQIPPNETSIGVRLVWSYHPPTGFATFTISLNEYTVLRAAPVLA
ncbi:MAG: pilus assembly protein [Chloroflexi bacterium]|nr:MAG: pilus assembly protein [Chloroflexota bacterium]